jgi:hypothetical protein
MPRKPEVTKERVSSGRKSAWRRGFADGEVIQRVRPTEHSDYIANPHRGTATFQCFNGDLCKPGEQWDDGNGPLKFNLGKKSLKNTGYPQTTVSYCRWAWDDIEPQPGKFRWDIIEGALKAAQACGQTLQTRLQPFAGSRRVPEWFWAQGGVPSGDSKGRPDPDANHSSYIKYWSRLTTEFAKRFDGHPALESVDVAIAGACAEGGGNATDKTIEYFVDLHIKHFKKTQLLSNMSGHQFEYGISKGLGWRADCYGDTRTEGKGAVPDNKNWNHMFDYYPRMLAEGGAVDTWKTAPITLETCWTVGYWHEHGWPIDWIIEQGYRYHMSIFMPKSCPVPEEWADKMDAFDRKIGYRFVLRQLALPLAATPGGQIEVQAWVNNVGVAPIYRPYKFAYRFRQGKKEEVVYSSEDIRKWLPEQTWFTDKITVPRSLKHGVLNFDVGIVDSATNKPVVRFAVKETDESGWHPMTCMDVV